MLLCMLANGATKQDPQTLLSEMLPWLILLFGAVIAGGVIIFWVKRSMSESDASGKGDTGFTLHELRELHRKGEISDAEYERARAALIGAFQSKQDVRESAAEANDELDASDNAEKS